MLEVDAYSEGFAARLLDFFGQGTQWQRRLWHVSLVLGLREVLEAAEAARDGVLSDRSLAELKAHLREMAGPDPGVGSSEQRRVLQDLLSGDLSYGGHAYLELVELLPMLNESYLANWAATLSADAGRPSFERAARAIAAHLLDSGFSSTYLHKWWTYRIDHEGGEKSVADLVHEALELVNRGLREYQVLMAFSKAPRGGSLDMTEWRSASEVATWLRSNEIDTTDVRQYGGLLPTVEARDNWSAVEEAAGTIERLTARAAVGSRSRLEALGSAWVYGSPYRFRLSRTSRFVEVHALERGNAVFNVQSESRIDAAIELLSTLDNGSSASAVASGWAATEALLYGAGDAHRGIAADRLAALVAASFPRAELTTLAYAHEQNCADETAERIRAAKTNREKTAVLQDAIERSSPLSLVSAGDRAAVVRMEKMLRSPNSYLKDVKRLAAHAIRRLYRQRNLVMHWGHTTGIALEPCLRTAAPLVGAGMDRIVHAWFASGTSPLELAARASVQLSLVGSDPRVELTSLLE
jgi:hypothetical protein